MAVLPEEFPVVLTVFLALGAWRISQNNVLTRRVPAVETLGSATVLCTDKTGTLTLNHMKVKKIFASGQSVELDDGRDNLPEAIHEVVEFSILASQMDPFDPMEKAFKRLGEDYLADVAIVYVVLSFIAVMLLCRIYINLYQHKRQDKKEDESHDR